MKKDHQRDERDDHGELGDEDRRSGTGAAWTCFHALFRSSICVIRVTISITAIGRIISAMASHAWTHSGCQNLGAR